MGGWGSITGSLLGACVIGVLSDGLVMLGVSQFWQMVIKGAVIILAVAIDQLQTTIQARFLPLLLRTDEGSRRVIQTLRNWCTGAAVLWPSFSACHRPDTSKKLIVVIMPSQDNPFFKAEADAAAVRAVSLGYRVRVDAHDDDATGKIT